MTPQRRTSAESGSVNPIMWFHVCGTQEAKHQQKMLKGWTCERIRRTLEVWPSRQVHDQIKLKTLIWKLPQNASRSEKSDKSSGGKWRQPAQPSGPTGYACQSRWQNTDPAWREKKILWDIVLIDMLRSSLDRRVLGQISPKPKQQLSTAAERPILFALHPFPDIPQQWNSWQYEIRRKTMTVPAQISCFHSCASQSQMRKRVKTK